MPGPQAQGSAGLSVASLRSGAEVIPARPRVLAVKCRLLTQVSQLVYCSLLKYHLMLAILLLLITLLVCRAHLRATMLLAVFVNKLTKYVYAVPCKDTSDAVDWANMYVEHVVQHEGLSSVIISDRGPQSNSAKGSAGPPQRPRAPQA